MSSYIKNTLRLLLVLLSITAISEWACASQSTLIPKLDRNFFNSNNEDDFLEPEQAFKLAATVQDGKTIVAEFSPAQGYYLYRHRITFNVESPTSISIAKVELPPGETKNDAAFGETKVFHQPFSAIVNLKREANSPNRLKLKATYQGCSEKGICYPPISKTFDLALNDTSALPGHTQTPSTEPSTPLFSDGGIADALANGSSWFAIGVFFLAGIGLAFTPCVLPMIPILSGIIAGHGQTVTRKRGFTLALSYVLGMSITYALAGVAAALTGSLLATALQNAWVLGTFALVFALLALSMFGMYELRMPAIIQSRAHSLSGRLSGGKMAAVFTMGALSALIVSPCVAAPLAGALLYISQTGDVVLGGTALFAMALGMGAPLLAIGISAGTFLPKAGAWMDSVKRFFGVLLLAVAIWLVSPIIPIVVQMLAWATLLITSAMFLRAADPLPVEASGISRFGKGVGLIALIMGIAILVGALSGSRDLLQPLIALRSTNQIETDGETGFEKVRTLSELEQRLEETDRPVMLDFYADWCISCKEMEQLTYRDMRVVARLQDLLLLQVDVTQNTLDDQALLKRFGLFGPPGVIFFDPAGREIRGTRVIGYQSADKFLRAVDKVLDAAASADKPTLTLSPQPLPLRKS